LNVEIEIIISFCLVNGICVPEFNVTITSRGHNVVLIPNHNFYVVFVAILLGGKVYQTFYEVSFPQQQSAVFSARKHFSIRESVESRNVGQFNLPEFGDVSFEFEACKGFSNFPKSSYKSVNLI
jgi:hypothetical protein